MEKNSGLSVLPGLLPRPGSRPNIVQVSEYDVVGREVALSDFFDEKNASAVWVFRSPVTGSMTRRIEKSRAVELKCRRIVEASQALGATWTHHLY